MIANRRIEIRRRATDGPASLPEQLERELGPNALRWYIAQATSDSLGVEATFYNGELNRPTHPDERRYFPGRSVVVSVIPTGIGCSIGGFAGDASPVTNLLASTADYVVTNPNALNASNFIGLDSKNIVYADGSCIDLLCKGSVDLHLPYSNRIGVVIEKADEKSLETVFNVLNTMRAVHGVDILDYVITDRPIGGRCVENESGAFVGTVDNPEVLFESCQKLLRRGADAIAITSNIQDLPLGNYAKHFNGNYPNPVGGVEAIISYLVTSRFRVPVAHAPMINIKQMDLNDRVVDARGAGEMASESGLACILVGLRRAPQIEPDSHGRVTDVFNINNVVAIVAPASALGGVPSIYSQKYNVPVIAVEGNSTILNVTKSALGLRNVIEVRNYAEAAGVILAIKTGIGLEAISRPLKTLKHSERL